MVGCNLCRSFDGRHIDSAVVVVLVAHGGVDEVNTRIKGTSHNIARLTLPNGPLMKIGRSFSEAHAAQALLRDLDAGMTEGGVLHGAPFAGEVVKRVVSICALKLEVCFKSSTW